MSSVVVYGDTSGAITLAANAVAGTNTITLPPRTGNVAVDGPSFSAYANTTTSVTNGTTVKVTYNVEEWDTNSNYDPSLSRFTPTVAGYYQITAQVYSGATSSSFLSIYKNGSAYIRGTPGTPTNDNYLANGLVFCNGSTDYIEMYFQNNSGSTATLGGYSFIKFQACLVRGA